MHQSEHRQIHVGSLIFYTYTCSGKHAAFRLAMFLAKNPKSGIER